jgi:hypothetical protein
VTCDYVDSNYVQQKLLNQFERLYFYSGKDTENRFYTLGPPNVATLGRSGYTNEESNLDRGALIQEIYEEKSVFGCSVLGYIMRGI